MSASYAENGWLRANDGWFGSVSGIRHLSAPATRYFYDTESAVRRPSVTPLFVDAIFLTFWPLETDREDTTADLYHGLAKPTSIYDMRYCLLDRHGKRAAAAAPRGYVCQTNSLLPGAVNMAFLDGHAENVRLANMWDFSWHKSWVTRQGE